MGKREAIREALSKTFTVERTTFDGAPGISFTNLLAGTKVTFKPGDTGEGKDRTFTANATRGPFGFDNTLFASVDAFGNPSTFTGGIMTNIGEISSTISAHSLPALDGITIAHALFAELTPEAASIGASIFENGDTLDVDFNGTTVGGVIFGTTSLSDGVFGAVTTPVAEPMTVSVFAAGLLSIGLLRRRALPKG